MPIEELLAVVSAPPDPVETGSPETWPAVEAQLGLTLPSDYKRFIEVYGSVDLGRFLAPFNPFSANPATNLATRISEQLHVFREIRVDEGTFPYPIYPEPGGALPWGDTYNGDVFSWLTEGPPDAWPVALTQARDDDHARYDGDMTAFLARWLTGDLVCALFPPNVPDRAALCRPLRRRRH